MNAHSTLRAELLPEILEFSASSVVQLYRAVAIKKLTRLANPFGRDRIRKKGGDQDLVAAVFDSCLFDVELAVPDSVPR